MISESIEFESLNWDKANGLLPVIIQDNTTFQVLMLGFMNKEALQQTIQTGKITFYSRTKKRLWVKGETSGNYLTFVKMFPDCDKDTLLIFSNPTGPACHFNTSSCFGEKNISVLSSLEMTIKNRYEKRPSDSYTTELFNQGIERITQKVGEESIEVIIAALRGSTNNIINETADLLFHLLVLLRQCKIDLMDVMTELDRRCIAGR